MQSTAYTAPIAAKLINARPHYVDFLYTEFRQNRPRNMGSMASGVPRNFVRGGGQQIQLRTERTGIWGAVAP